MKNLLLASVLFAGLFLMGNAAFAACAYEEGCGSASQWCWGESCVDCSPGFSNCDLVQGCETQGACAVEEEEEVPPEEECLPGEIVTETSVSSAFRCDEFAVYKCVNNACGKAGGAMEQGKKWYMCKTTTETWTDGCDSGNTSDTEHVSGPHGPDQIRPFGEVGDYQQCPAGYNDWGAAIPKPECAGSCYPAPNLKPLDDESLLPKNVSENAKYKLPVNFGWEDNIEKKIAEAPSHCAVKAYEFNIAAPPISKITAGNQLQNIEDQPYKLECRLKPSSAYQWKVRACLDESGTDCGEWPDSQGFDTGPAPELISPYDPDWSDEDGAENIGLPTTLDWCDVEKANSYALRVYVVQGGERVCHPNLLTAREGGQFCEPLVLKKEWRTVEQEEKTLFSDFTDEDLNFFTKNTSYLWDIAACLSEDGFDCEFSQQWAFATGEKELAGTFLISPPNDPSGQTPIELPLILNWRKDAGINSWLYKIGQTQELTTVPQSRSFNYPELSLNTPYRWQALSCWDYEGKKCQDSWSEIYSFTTTGRPPRQLYPSAGDSDIIIPVNFDWEDVPGARSYIFKIQGNGLAVEKTVDESEFSLDYPDLKMSSNYSWQVKTCAKESGQICGGYSSPQGFRTFKLAPPSAPEAPSNGGMLFTDERYVSWEKVDGAKAYQYQMRYLSMDAEEQDQACANAVGRELFGQPKNVSVKSDFVELLCLGQYQWQARSCLDQPCQETSDWSGAWTFTLSEGGAAKGGLTPCGRKADTLDTPWNEREPCQVKHLFLLVKIIIDFLLFRLVPFGLVLLTIYTAFIFYLSWKGVGALAQVISLWKATGAGLVIMFFAWTAVNIFLKLIGYQIGVFGNWYQF